jgi:hypothetical protein
VGAKEEERQRGGLRDGGREEGWKTGRNEINKTKKCIWKKCAPKTSLSVQKYKTVVHLSTMREHQQFGNVIKCNIRVIIVWYVWTPYDPVIASRTVVTGLLHMKQQLTAEDFIRISSH